MSAHGQGRGGGDTYVVDIETVGEPWDALDVRTRDYLLGRAANDAERESVPRRLGLSPGTGRILVIGMLNTRTGQGGVLVDGPHRDWSQSSIAAFKRFDGSEAEILVQFWKLLESQAGRIVTFNGRAFDGPYLMLRSAILGVRPSRNLVPARGRLDEHCDLADVLTLGGAVRTNFTFDYWCRRFGIESPKDEGLDGSKVQAAYEAGRLEEIVAYCARDVLATAELYKRLDRTLLPVMDASSRRPG